MQLLTIYFFYKQLFYNIIQYVNILLMFFCQCNATSSAKNSSIYCNDKTIVKIYPIYPRINLNSTFEEPGISRFFILY